MLWGEPSSLCDSYKVAVPIASKTYAPGGTSKLDPGKGSYAFASELSAAVMRAFRENFMLDLMMLALGLAFFAAAVGYTYACERL